MLHTHALGGSNDGLLIVIIKASLQNQQDATGSCTQN
jgi:hypothetical protein